MLFYNRGGNMEKEVLLYEFLNNIKKNNKLTLFFKIVFDYDILYDYNYISRFFIEKNSLIIDIYDNVLDNRFNRYIFDFNNNSDTFNNKIDDYVRVTTINVNSIYDIDNNMMKLAYLFSDNCYNMNEYAKTFMPPEIVDILNNIIKK